MKRTRCWVWLSLSLISGGLAGCAFDRCHGPREGRLRLPMITRQCESCPCDGGAASHTPADLAEGRLPSEPPAARGEIVPGGTLPSELPGNRGRSRKAPSTVPEAPQFPPVTRRSMLGRPPQTFPGGAPGAPGERPAGAVPLRDRAAPLAPPQREESPSDQAARLRKQTARRDGFGTPGAQASAPAARSADFADSATGDDNPFEPRRVVASGATSDDASDLWRYHNLPELNRGQASAGKVEPPPYPHAPPGMEWREAAPAAYSLERPASMQDANDPSAESFGAPRTFRDEQETSAHGAPAQDDAPRPLLITPSSAHSAEPNAAPGRVQPLLALPIIEPGVNYQHNRR